MIEIEGQQINEQSLPLAYEASMKTYDWALKRIDAWDGNINQVLAWGTPITIALVGRIASLEVVKHSQRDWFLAILSSLFVIVAIIAGFWGKFSCKIQLLSPSFLLENWIAQDDAHFRFWGIHFAGVHFDQNTKIIDRKFWAATVSVAAFIISAIISVIAWVGSIS